MTTDDETNPLTRQWRRRRRAIISAAILVPALLSLGVHAALGLYVRYARLAEARPDRLTDTPGPETLLVLDGPAAPPPERRTLPPPPPLDIRSPQPRPSPVPEPMPEIKSPEETTQTPAAPSPAAPPPDTQPADPAPPAPPTVFAGMKAARAEKLVYVVDASGAMTSSLAFVLEELSRSITRLEESQSFQVVLFRERPSDAPSRDNGTGFEMFRPNLIPANPANKDAARAWLTTIRPVGRSMPLPGLRAALDLKPDLVFLLTRSIPRSGPTQEWGAGNGAVLASLDDLNPVSPFTGRRRVVIKTIQFIDDDPSGLLQAIAAQHGDGSGSYAIRRLEELRDDNGTETVEGEPAGR